MAELKTKENDASVADFLAAIPDEQKRMDSIRLCKIFEEISGEPAKMWGSSIVGFGNFHYVYPSGREGDWMKTGFSPRKASLTLYFMDGFNNHTKLLDKIGKYTTSKSCLYIKKLSDIDEKTLRQMIKDSIKNVETNKIQY
jgi:hypothetical protein